MLRRFFISLLLIGLMLSGASRTLSVPRADDDLATTVEEEREARALVEEFNKKLNETNDIAPLIKEYFVADFAARLPQHTDTFPFSIKWKDETTPPTPSDLQQFYVAATNFLHILAPIWLAADEQSPAQEGEHEAQLRDALPPAAVELMQREPALRPLVLTDDKETQPGAEAAAEKKDERIADSTKAEAGDVDTIENAEQLHHLACVFEDLTKILRAHLAAHPVAPAHKTQSVNSATDDADDSDRLDPDKVEVFKDARILDEEFYGYPAGTRLVCASAGLLHVELVRVDGRLRILTVYLLVDD